MAAEIAAFVLSALCALWIAGALVGLRVLRAVPRLPDAAGVAEPAERAATKASEAHTEEQAGRLAEAPARPAAGPLLAIVVPAANEAGDAAAVADLRAAHASRLTAAARLAAGDLARTLRIGGATGSATGGAAAPSPVAARPGVEVHDAALVELISVDDRSTDATGAVLDELASGNGGSGGSAPAGGNANVAAGRAVAIRVLHVRELPEGWLGKTHALHKGVEAAARAGMPRWILLTDADVRLEPDALVRAIAHAEARGLEHLTLMPQLDQGGLLRDATLGAFGRLFGLGSRLWAVNDPRSSASIGVGAFNLVRHEALLRVGGLRRVRLEVADDMALAALLRREGARQGVASGRGAVRLAWYRSVPAILRGIEKGVFGYGARCEPWRAFAGAALLLVLELAPWAALLLGAARWVSATTAATSPAAAVGGASPSSTAIAWPWATLALLGALAIALGILVVALGERWMGRRMLPALLLPLGGLVMAFAALRAGWTGWRRGGVLWRGTLYPSSLLREAMSWEGGTRSGRRRAE